MKALIEIGDLTIADAERFLKGKVSGDCAACEGWGCHACCASDAEIRARQGIFG